jgi:hypothetical protein
VSAEHVGVYSNSTSYCHYLVILTVQSLSLLGITVLLFPVGSPSSSGVTVV